MLNRELVDGWVEKKADDRKALVVLSGGQDSTTCLYLANKLHSEVEAIIFDYGQAHIEETPFAVRACDSLGAKYTLIDLQDVFLTHKSTMLARNKNKPLKKDKLPPTFLLGRNSIFLAIAYSMAATNGASVVYTGVGQTDYSGYPDCRQDAILALQSAMEIGTDKYVSICTPLMHLSKADTFLLAYKLDRLSEIICNTLTCYRGEMTLNEWGRGCGKCPACLLRKDGYAEFVSEEGNSQ